VPHKSSEIEKVVSTARHAIAVQCVYCGINDQIVKSFFRWAQMA